MYCSLCQVTPSSTFEKNLRCLMRIPLTSAFILVTCFHQQVSLYLIFAVLYILLHKSAYLSFHIHHHHQILLLLVEHRASMKSFQELRFPFIPLTSFHDLLVLLISSSIVLRHVLYLSVYIPEDFNLMRFSLLLVFLCVMCVQSSSIFFFLSDFLLTSDL